LFLYTGAGWMRVIGLEGFWDWGAIAVYRYGSAERGP